MRCLWLIILLMISGCGIFNFKVANDDIEMRTNIAKEFIRNGNVKAGHQILASLREDYGENKDIALTIANAYFDQGNYPSAEKYYRLAGKIEKNPLLLTGIGRVALAQNKVKKAKKKFKKALAFSPDYAPALNGLAVVYDLKQKHKKAQKIYLKILNKEPENKLAMNNLALSYAFSNKTSEAEDIFQKLISNNNDNPGMRQNLAIVLMMKGKWRAARHVSQMDLENYTVERNIKFLKKNYVKLDKVEET